MRYLPCTFVAKNYYVRNLYMLGLSKYREFFSLALVEGEKESRKKQGLMRQVSRGCLYGVSPSLNIFHFSQTTLFLCHIFLLYLYFMCLLLLISNFLLFLIHDKKNSQTKTKCSCIIQSISACMLILMALP